MHNRKLNDLKGRTLKSKVCDQAFKYLLEEKRRRLGYQPRLCAIALVIVDRNKEITGIGGSEPSDLILDQFGNFLAGIHAPLSSGAGANFSMKDVGGNTRTMNPYNGAAGMFYSSTAGIKMQVGKGAVGTRTDVTIGSAFAVAPESGMFNSGIGSYAGGTATASGSITAGGAGTISEAGLFSYWMATSGSLYYFMLCHDNVSPTAGFVAGQSITCQYAWAL